MEKIRVLALDPSVNRCGYASALFTPVGGFRLPQMNAKGDCTEGVEPMTWCERSSKWSWGYFDMGALGLIARLREIVQFIGMIYPDGHDIFIGEYPTFYNVERGHIAAIRGDTTNLAAINGYVAGHFRLPPNQIHFITATKWKGSVSKEITRQRFFKSFGIAKHYKIDHNAVDAAMMLLTWCQRTGLVSRDFVNFEKELEPSKMLGL